MQPSRICAVFLLVALLVLAVRRLTPVTAKDTHVARDLKITSQANISPSSRTAFEFENGWDEGAIWDVGPAYDLSEPVR